MMNPGEVSDQQEDSKAGKSMKGQINEPQWLSFDELIGLINDGFIDQHKGNMKEIKTPKSGNDHDINKVINPEYYNKSPYLPEGVELYDIIGDMPYGLGCAIKYIFRAGLKESSSYRIDLKKAIRYLQLELERTQDGD